MEHSENVACISLFSSYYISIHDSVLICTVAAEQLKQQV